MPRAKDAKVWFPRVKGHEAAKQALRRSLESDRLMGSILLLGPDGVGRELLARELAKAIHCRDEGATVPCGSCGPCQRVERKVHGDCQFIRPSGRPSISIDQVKATLAELALAPVEGGRRVFCFTPAGALSEPAQNALLKGLEEPPERALIVLIAERADELLTTIVSRCKLLQLDELGAELTVEILVEHGLPVEDARARAAWSGGSPGRALAENAPAVAALAEKLVDAFTTGRAYADAMETVDLLTDYVQTGKVELETQRGRIKDVIALLARTLRDALVQRELGPTPSRLSGARPDLVERLADLPRGRLEAAVDHLARVEDELDQNVNPKFLLDGLVLDVGTALMPGRRKGVPAG